MRRPLSPSWIVPAALGLLVAGAVPRSVGAFDLSTCTSVPDGLVADLTGDLVCAPDEAIQLGRKATLRMNGHSVSSETPTSGIGILCERSKCRIEGPGEVFGFADIGIVGLSSSQLEIADVRLHDNGVGIIGDRVRLSDVEVEDGTGAGVLANKIAAVGVTASGNGEDGITANACRLTDVVASNDARSGVSCRRLNALRLTAAGNGGFGVLATRPGTAKLVDSTITGNAADDVASEHRPSVKGSTCGTSRRLDGNGADAGTWGVCTAD